jgi:ligand-binding sensor domain-containing protein
MDANGIKSRSLDIFHLYLLESMHLGLSFHWRTLLAVVICLTAPYVNAQTPIYELLGRDQGLQGRTFYQCFQDSKQRLWVTSENGVSLLDEQKFKMLDAEVGMTEMVVLRVGEDVKGNLWFLTMNGIPAKYDGRVVTTQWGNAFAKKIRGANYLSAFAAAKDGSVIFGTHDGRAFRILPDGSHEFLFEENWGAVQVIDAHDDGSLTFHFSKVNAIATWKDGKIHYRPFQQFLAHWNYGTLRTTQLENGRYIYGVENRFALVERSADTLRVVSLQSIPEKNILFVDQDATGDLWLGTNEGAIKYEHEDSLFLFPKRFLPAQFVTSVIRDHEGGIWFTTREGLFHCRNENIFSSGSEFCIQSDEATSIFSAGDGNMYLGFESGKVQQVSRKTFQVLKEFPNPFVGSNSRIQRFADGPEGSVLAGGYAGLVSLKDGEQKVLARLRLADISVHQDQLCACLHSNWGQVQMDSKGDWTSSVEKQLQVAQGIKASRCLHSEYGENGDLWISTFTDILRIRAGKVDTLYSGPGTNPGTRNSGIGITEDNRLILGTANHGLFILSSNKTFHLGVENGLLDNHVTAFVEDQGRIIWVFTAKGLSKVSIESEKPRVLGSVSRWNFFGGANVNDFTVLNDTLWAAAGNGFIMFPIHVLQQIPQAPRVKIANIMVNDAIHRAESPLTLDYFENDLRIHYQAITFSDPQSVEYRYRIGSAGGNFQTTYAQTIDLPNLSPGEYRLEIQARYPFGAWGTESTVLEFQILAPFWQQAWFLVLCFLVIAGIIYLAVRSIIRNIRKQGAIRESLLTAKHNALINQMNPHFVFNSLNSIQNFVLTKETEAANNYLADFAALMRAILVNGRSTYVLISEEVKFLNFYLRLEALRLDHKFDYTISVSRGISANSNVLPTMMLQPLLENSIWHGIVPLKDRRGNISIELGLRGDYVECLVADNGIGRKEAALRAQKLGRKHQSMASTIMKERIDLMNQNLKNQIRLEFKDLEDEEGNGVGTEVRLFIPLSISKEHAS